MASLAQLSGKFTCNGFVAAYDSKHLSIDISGDRARVSYTQGVVSIEQISKALEHITEINALLYETGNNEPFGDR